MRKIKLLWEFRTTDAKKLAEHHAIHLKEFLDKEEYDINIVNFETISPTFAVAYMVVHEKDMIKFRDILKPHRAVVYKED